MRLSSSVYQVFRGRYQGQSASDSVIPTIRGKPFYSHGLRAFYKDVEAAGLNRVGIHIHGLRRTFATKLIKAGADPKTVQALLGHSTLNLTLQLYTDAKVMDLKGAIDRMPDLKVREPVPIYKVAS